MAGELLALTLAGCATALATGLGAVPVFLLGSRVERLRPLLWGLAAGLMGVASIVGLLLPALEEGSSAAVVLGLATGVAFLLLSRRALAHRDVHVGALQGRGCPPGAAGPRRPVRPQPPGGLRDRHCVRVRA
jgi:ZIP family zinc transporter